MIKIADFGLSEDIYAKNYFRQSGSDKSVKLPVKWMAPESLSDGVFSEKTDVVGFRHPSTVVDYSDLIIFFIIVIRVAVMYRPVCPQEVSAGEST